jgi:hypothetical protein
MARKTSAKPRQRREKKEMANNIRKRVLSAQQNLVDQSKEVEGNQAMATAVSSVAVSIEALSEGMDKLFKDMIEELSKIPETVKDQEAQSEKILEKLITAILDLEDQLGKETDPEKRKALEGQIGVLKGEASKAYDKTAAAKVPRTMGQMAAKFLGVDAKELKDAGGGVGGFLKAFVGTGPDKGLRGDVPKYFGLDSKMSLEDKMTAARGSREIAGTLERAKEEKENERKAAIAARLKDTPEHLRVKSDDMGRYRVGTKGGRIDEFMPSGALNPRFQPASGMMGKQLQDEATGYTYEAGKGVQAGMVPGGAGASVLESKMMGGTDTETDEFKTKVLDYLEETNENLEDMESATLDSKGLLGNIGSILGGLGGTLVSGISGALKGLIPGFLRNGGTPDVPGGAPGGAPGAPPTRAGGRLARFGRGLGRVARFAGRAAGVAAVGMAAYDAYRGFNADENATTGERIRNAGSNVLSGLTFGLLGKSSDEIQAEAAQRAEAGTSASPVAASMAPAPASPVAASMAPVAASAPMATASRSMMAPALAATAPAPASAAPVINNIDNSQRVNAPQASTSSGGASVSLRDTHNSYMRFQERRMSRIF